jgi:hypothetical protein
MFKKKLVTIDKNNHTCILLQNENGPCSLISIGIFFFFFILLVNVLLIRNSEIVSTIPRNEMEISQEYIISILVDFLLKKVNYN